MSSDKSSEVLGADLEQREAIRSVFDAEYYLRESPDVRAAGVDPLDHFMLSGWKENRNPNANFDTEFYLRSNPDVVEAGVNPLLHYIEFGLREGRHPRPTMRNEYKAVWNSVALSEENAKLAVSGYTDENLYDSTAQSTLTMLEALVGVRADDVFLEIGAGVGRVGAVVAPLCREWIGIDVSENMVSHIRKRLRMFGNVRAIATNGFDLAAIPSSSIDVVYSTVVFMHLDEWDRFNCVAEAFRVLRPGGRMLVDNINLLSDEGWAIFEAHRAIPSERRPAQISKTSTPQELETYFKRAGFTDVRQRESGVWIITWGAKPQV